MKTIGIIGGSTDLATAEYYKIINAAIRRELGGLHTAEVIINSMDCGRITHYTQHSLWDEGAAYMNNKARSLERAGADFILSVSNTWHGMADVYMRGVGIPLLHIADPTARAIRERGCGVVGLLGTRATMSSDYLRGYFLERHGIRVVAPPDEQQVYVDGVIFGELAHGKSTDEAREGYLAVVDGLVARQGAQGVILGCTEINLLVSQADRPEVPMFNTLELHAEAAAVRALGD